jgi:hypothetical protein
MNMWMMICIFYNDNSINIVYYVTSLCIIMWEKQISPTMGKYVISIILVSLLKLKPKTSQTIPKVILFQVKKRFWVETEMFLILHESGTVPNGPLGHDNEKRF